MASKLKILVRCFKEIENWHAPVLQYFNVIKKKKIIKFKNGLKCYLRDRGDAIAFFENFFLDVNFPSKKFDINESDTVIDIGAHIGFFTIIAAVKAKRGKILAFEPNNKSFELLRENIKLNKFENTIITNSGVLDITGKAELFLSDDYSIGNSMFLEKSDKKEIVEVVTLSDIINAHQIKKINLLKLDCEGAEFKIILNLNDDIIKKIEKITVEVHPKMANRSINELKEFLNKKGFLVQKRDLGGKEDLHMLYAVNQSY